MNSLTNPIWYALTTSHSSVSLGSKLVRAYPADTLPFVAIQESCKEADDEMSVLIETGRTVGILSVLPSRTDGWETVKDLVIAQYVWPVDRIVDETDDEVVALGSDHVEAMLDLTSRVYPAYFRPKTAALGPYFGIEMEGKLVAMAGVRMAFPGFREVSAVCTDLEFRGRGLGQHVTRSVVSTILASGNRPFLHTEFDNEAARKMYEKMGFTLHQTLPLRVMAKL